MEEIALIYRYITIFSAMFQVTASAAMRGPLFFLKKFLNLLIKEINH